MPMPISLLGHNHVCPVIDPGPKPHVGGPIVQPGQAFVRFSGIPWAVVSGQSVCTGMPGPDPLVSGSAIVRINGMPVVRIGDSTAHGGKVVMGVPTLRAD